MKSSNLQFLAICSTAILACSNPERDHRNTPSRAMDPAANSTVKAHVATADIDMNGKEKAFAINAHLASTFWQEAGTAASKSSNMDIAALGKELSDTHQKLGKNLKAIAKGKGLLLPQTLTEHQAKSLESLKRLTGTQLDHQFLMLLQESQASLTSLYSSAKGFGNRDLITYADNASSAVQARQQTTARLIRQLSIKESQNLQTSPQP